jgi:hypothetical protein
MNCVSSSAPPQPGVYAMPTSASLGRPDVVIGTLPVDSLDALVLFDSGATYLFVSLEFAYKANLSRQEIGQSVVVSSPAGLISSSIVCPGCVISIDNEDFVANLMVIPLKPFTGCLASLSRFISRLGEKALPLYQLMKKSDTFDWTTQADVAFKS